MSLPLLGIELGLPVVTNNISCPNDGPPVRSGDPTLNSKSFLRVSASNAITIPDRSSGMYNCAPSLPRNVYGVPVAVNCPEILLH